MKDTRVYLRIDTETKEQWEEEAKIRGISLSQLIIETMQRVFYKS